VIEDRSPGIWVEFPSHPVGVCSADLAGARSRVVGPSVIDFTL